MNQAYELGVKSALEKVARSTFRPRAIAEFIAEGGRISKSMVGGRGKISPGELRRAQKNARKVRRKTMAAEETTRRSRALQLFRQDAPTVISRKKV